MRGNRRTRSIRSNRKVKSSRSLRGGMRSKRTKSARRSRSLRKTRSARRSRSLRKTRSARRSRSVRRSRRNMKGGYIEYAPLPCDANGNTDWESTNQVGRESCVDYGTDGAELDARASKFGYDMEGLAYEKASSKLSEEDAKLLADAREALRAQNNKENTPEISPKFNNAFKEYQKASDALSKAEVATNPTLSPSAIDDLQAEVKAAGNAMRASVNSNNK